VHAVVSLAQLVANGLVFSCIIILASIGLSLIYSIADFANFAHGDTMTVGAFGAFVGAAILGEGFEMVVPFAQMRVPLPFVDVVWNVGAFLPNRVMLNAPFPDVVLFELPLSLYGGLLVGMAVAGGVVILTQRYVYEPLKNAGSIELLITSIGVALAYRAVVQILFGSSQRTYEIARQGRMGWLSEATGIALTPRDVVVVVLTAVLVVGLHALLQYTTLGRKMRATADNPNLARVSGIRTREVILAMWLIGGGLAAAGGVFLGIDTLVRPRMGFDLLLVVFAAVILGGIGSVYGAMLGGLVIGMAHELTPAIPFVPVEYASAVAFVLMVVILLVRPSGIMGEAV
jgi:branched-chain amino acid transport system permease protein